MSETDIVARLRAYKKMREFDNWGMYVDVRHEPSDLDLEAADIIERQAADLSRMREALAAAKRLCDDINEFGGLSDEVFLDVALAKICAALSPAQKGEA